MEQFKGTSTEWFAIEFAGFIILKDSDCYEGNNILDYSDVGDVVANANAKLAVCAPEMLTALQKFVELFKESDMRPEDECHELYEQINDVIKKATS